MWWPVGRVNGEFNHGFLHSVCPVFSGRGRPQSGVAAGLTHEHTNAQVLTVIPAKAGMTMGARVGLTPE